MQGFSAIISAEDGGRTVKEYIKRFGLSATLIKRVKLGGILRNGEAVTVRAILDAGDRLEIVFPEEKSEAIEPMDIPIEVLYEDEHILAVSKPANMPTHPSRGNSLPTLANAVMGLYGGEMTFRAVNRLDRDTSGIVLIAKNQFSASRLADEMKAGGFVKKYTAIVCGVPRPGQAVIDAPIERECEGSMRRVVREDGKRAITEYRTLAVRDDGNAVCELTLHTGRTHQIRVHMAHIGHPLVGDFLYGERGEGSYSLHACELSFTHPISGERITVRSRPPFSSE